ncbi:hypothetical protein ACF1AJ_17125 [Leifsonia sp. NPDC014704]|uniref:hypothetical protein n=1 Tax=Leifsonia sp. NPDC014704 TaxID=3364123 RepID=UPI0036F4A809
MLAVHRRTGSRARPPRALGLAVAVAVAVAVALTSCSPFGSVALKATTATNLANQKKAALSLLSYRPDVEEIRFTQPGSVGGGGSWAANAVVTIDGVDYDEILGPERAGGNPLPRLMPGTVPTRSTVVYSDGTSEALR